jgi:hypothetical protein
MVIKFCIDATALQNAFVFGNKELQWIQSELINKRCCNLET